MAGFVAAPRAGLEVSERLEGLKGASGSCGPVEKERLGLPEPIVWQLQEPVWHVSWQLQEPVEVHTKGGPRRRPGHG